MASHSRDELQNDFAHADGDAQDSELPSQAPDADQPGETDPATAGSLAVEDEELIEMLEQLNETLDSAKLALSEHQTIAGLTTASAAAMPAEADVPTPEPQRQSLIRPMLAAVLGMCIGAGGLAMLWPMWTSRQFPDLQAEPAAGGPKETRISRGMQAAPSGDGGPAAVPLPEPKPAPKTVRDRAPEPPPRVEAALALNHATPPMADVDAANAAAPAVEPGMADKPDFEEKDESNSMPVPGSAPQLVALPAAAEPPALTPEEEAALLTRGNGFLGHGDFASARLVFEHAAARGSAEAMFVLARTYDPRFLSERNAFGIKADRKRALDWYARAAERGHGQAGAMASELEQMTVQ